MSPSSVRGNIVRCLRHPRASDGQRQLVDHLRSGLCLRGGGGVSRTGEGAGTQEVWDKVKDEEDGHEPDNKTSPRPHLYIGPWIQC